MPKDENSTGTEEGQQATHLYKLAAPGTAGVTIPSGAVVSNAFDAEDEFQGYYLGQPKDLGIIEPPYVLKTLDRLVQENNALSPCIEAMVTNIEGTDFEFEKDQEETETEAEDATINEIWGFFLQPWPGESFITQRKNLRRDVERVGNGYLEILRTPQDEIVFTRHVDAKMMRMVKLDNAVPVTKTVTRRGRQVSMKVMMRERRFAQVLGGNKFIYFKEFGASRDLDKETGKWAAPGQRLPSNRRASEILHFPCLPDAHTPYGVPRWICQLPSVLGSRKAEEFNLEFFDNGGVPPVIIILQGGSMQSETRRAFEMKTSGNASVNNRVRVIEVEPIGGSMDKPGQSKVTVERFGSERQNDSMFEKYDERCEMRIRRAFRLPPIFVGMAGDYSFATAFASYTVTEAQVFKPERDEFDEAMNVKLLPAMGYDGYRMRSNALNIKDATLLLQGLEIALESRVADPGDIILAINDAVGTNLKMMTKGDGQPMTAEELHELAYPPPVKPERGPTGAPRNPAASLETQKPSPKSTPTGNPAVTKSEQRTIRRTVNRVPARGTR